MYLLKQQELITRMAMSVAVGERPSGMTGDKIKIQRHLNEQNSEWIEKYYDQVNLSHEYSEKIIELQDLSDQIPDSDERYQGQLLQETLVKTIELLEDTVSTKETEENILKGGYKDHDQILKEVNQNVALKSGKIKKMRVETLKKTSAIEIKLEALNMDPEGPADPLPEGTQNINLNQKEEEFQSEADDILNGLKSKLEVIGTGDNQEQHFLRDLPKAR